MEKTSYVYGVFRLPRSLAHPFFPLLSRRLRDKLIENESLTLAMEVTTKCGLDAGAVWGAWGLAYLQVGKFKEARQKFSKFLKVCCFFSKYLIVRMSVCLCILFLAHITGVNLEP